jgi:hypothetical protein
MFSHIPVIEESGYPRDGQVAPVVCGQISQGVKEYYILVKGRMRSPITGRERYSGGGQVEGLVVLYWAESARSWITQKVR